MMYVNEKMIAQVFVKKIYLRKFITFIKVNLGKWGRKWWLT